MDREPLNLFASRFPDFASWNATQQTDYLAYYLLTHVGIESVTVSDVEKCFKLLDLRPYSRSRVYFSEEIKKKGGRYVKHEKGYRLERAAYDAIRIAVDAEPTRVHVAKELTDFVPKIKNSQERLFLEEAIRCHRVESYRATIVMVWVLTMDHLQNHVFGNKLKEFNAALSVHPDKRMKPIVSYDDFSELKEVRIIELMRTAGIISNDVKKILDEKLGIRNSAGHPSGITFSGHKTTEFTLDLLQNVLLKY
ncbi:MAG: hypothetical protein WA021_02220 [Minisyncoccia bacterium]